MGKDAVVLFTPSQQHLSLRTWPPHHWAMQSPLWSLGLREGCVIKTKCAVSITIVFSIGDIKNSSPIFFKVVMCPQISPCCIRSPHMLIRSTFAYCPKDWRQIIQKDLQVKKLVCLERQMGCHVSDYLKRLKTVYILPESCTLKISTTGTYITLCSLQQMWETFKTGIITPILQMKKLTIYYAAGTGLSSIYLLIHLLCSHTFSDW